MSKWLPSVVQGAGLLVLSFGAWLVWAPAGFITAGVSMIAAGVGLERQRA